MAPFRGFWDSLASPIIGLSPMDGVTDASFRYITSRHSKPSLTMTEFTNVEGLSRGAVNMLEAFIYHDIERPVVAQIYGVEEESFYKVALMNCYLGFDGIDINMGCPANKVARRGSGAGLIRLPEQARKIVRTVKKAAEDWHNGITLEEAGLRPKVLTALKAALNQGRAGGSPRHNEPEKEERKRLPVSVKTRIGYDQIVAEWWMETLLKEEPANITLHGRTLKQMYTGEANWHAIARASAVCRGTGTTLLGNGDVKSLEDAYEKINTYGVDGVLVGRSTFGNPWFFSGHTPGRAELFKAAVEHCRYFEENAMKSAFFAMRKHLAWYCRGFDGAAELRKQLMQTNSSQEVEALLL